MRGVVEGDKVMIRRQGREHLDTERLSTSGSSLVRTISSVLPLMWVGQVIS